MQAWSGFTVEAQSHLERQVEANLHDIVMEWRWRWRRSTFVPYKNALTAERIECILLLEFSL